MSAPQTPDGEDVDAKIARLEQARADRDAKREEAAKLRRIEELELEERFSTEVGPRGLKFEIISNELGNFAFKLPDFVAFKRFNAKGQSITEEDVLQLVLPNVLHPARETATAVFREHAGIAWEAAVVLQGLYKARKEGREGKS